MSIPIISGKTVEPIGGDGSTPIFRHGAGFQMARNPGTLPAREWAGRRANLKGNGDARMTTQHAVRFSIVCGQRAPWPELADARGRPKRSGSTGFNVVDHFYGLKDVMDPTHEAYTILAGLAPVTSAGPAGRDGLRQHLPQSRLPAQAGGHGRSHLRTGGSISASAPAGWSASTRRTASTFPPPGSGSTASPRRWRSGSCCNGRSARPTTAYYQLLDAPFEPKPLQRPRLPVLIGASAPRMLRLTARHADIWNARGEPDVAKAESDGSPPALPGDRSRSRGDRPLHQPVPQLPRLGRRLPQPHRCLPRRRLHRFPAPLAPHQPEELPVLREVAEEVIPQYAKVCLKNKD